MVIPTSELRLRLAWAAQELLIDSPLLTDAERWLSQLSAADLVRVDEVARTRVWGGSPPLAPAPEWTPAVTGSSAFAAAIASLHPSGFVREQAVRQLGFYRDPLSDKMLALRSDDHVPVVRGSAALALNDRTQPQELLTVMPVLESLSARRHASVARVAYLDSAESALGADQVWSLLRSSDDRRLRRNAFRHSIDSGRYPFDHALRDLDHEHDPVVRRLLTCLIAEQSTSADVFDRLLRDRHAQTRALALVHRTAEQLGPERVEPLLTDKTVLVRYWAQRRWRELGRDPLVFYRSCRARAEQPRRRFVYLGLLEVGGQVDRNEALDVLAEGGPLALVGLRLLRPHLVLDDIDDLLDLVATGDRGPGMRCVRMAVEHLAILRRGWAASARTVASRFTDSEEVWMRRRGWLLRCTLGGWDETIADLQVLLDPDVDLASLGKNARAPQFLLPTPEQHLELVEVLDWLSEDDLPPGRAREIAFAAGLTRPR